MVSCVFLYWSIFEVMYLTCICCYFNFILIEIYCLYRRKFVDLYSIMIVIYDVL